MDTHEITGKVKEWEGQAEQGYGRMKDTATEAANDLIGDYGTTAPTQVGDAFEDAMDLVRRQPLGAVAGALLLGAGLGALLAYWSQD